MPALQAKAVTSRARELFCRDPDLTVDDVMRMLEDEGYEPKRPAISFGRSYVRNTIRELRSIGWRNIGRSE